MVNDTTLTIFIYITLGNMVTWHQKQDVRWYRLQTNDKSMSVRSVTSGLYKIDFSLNQYK